MSVIDVYFPIEGKTPGDCIGGISLLEASPNGKHFWHVAYKIVFITEKTILFQNDQKEFCTANGVYIYENASVKIETITNEAGKWLRVLVKET